MTPSLVGRRPVVPAASLLEQYVPPPHFADARLDTYRPDPAYPSQHQAWERMSSLVRAATSRRGRSAIAGTGIYLDGGFGVGKTHLLAGVAHALGDDAAFATFVEYTALVGALGFQAARQALQDKAVICIDEFELDDPGDTLLMARLMRELTDAGVCVVATSNTPPDALGEGRFAARDFLREIQALAAVFDVVSIEGEDYRHRDVHDFPPPLSESVVRDLSAVPGGFCESWDALVADLAHVHPSRMNAYVDGVSLLGLVNVRELDDQSHALRVVTLVDRLYDRDSIIAWSGIPLDQVFAPAMLAGGYRKKYQRALSRLQAMAYRADVATSPSTT